MVGHSKSITDITFSYLNLNGLGLEISPYFDPVMRKGDYKVHYTDYIGTEEIRAKAALNPGLAGRDVPEIDFVWQPGKPLASCKPKKAKYDYAVASHVLEHVPNPAGWLNEVLSVVKVGGHVALFLPDRRWSSDFFRKNTQVYQILQWWIEQPPVPTPGQILDFMINSFALVHGMNADWDPDIGPESPQRAYPDSEAISTTISRYQSGEYLDIHCTVWTSDTIENIFDRLKDLGILNAEVVNLTSDKGEFMVMLKKLGEPKRLPPQTKSYAAPIVDAPQPTELASAGDPHINHQLGILRHDLGFLIQEFDAYTKETRQHTERSRISIRLRTWAKILLGRIKL
ncbi:MULTISPECIES: methyltransferase domain-containing protein [Asticcacaulis]|uniref:Methyltransferase domain-containing protein n=1 Tax=Asticcacaulis endophyticus TaxID=1395890 RepID=A0A918PS98_9CAUL|nr:MULTISPECIES: methyltransferase domain-containing protein [Asticcacaulis]WKL58028.1 methyltransferase domain-containing protein [Asticcacaulis sp. ZE23SCel15]GGZ21488.1 hypothetical protein GCM10011273_02730 [Asticcacaulis endophyticus]